MKKLFYSTLIIACVATSIFAQKKVTIKAGTIVPLQSINLVKAADVEEGQSVDFRVINDIKVGDDIAISKGTLVKGLVTEARKSTIAGTKGRLKISINNMILPNGDPIYFSNTNISLSGHNRTPLAVVTALFVWPCIFIPGSKAVMPLGYEVHATIASNSEITL